ncbi:MAG TPA: carboxypeptidase-like regulatory domain-containing protein, partial [Kofleriaceae bacterium]|nr:carboxypeptidase-like regulatory domain-containing protein [Kofleriaceae bacterium]
MTRSRLAIVAVVLVTLAILVRGHSDDDTPASTALHAPASSFHPRTRAPGLALANASIAGTIRDDHGRGLSAAQLCARSIDALDAMVCTVADITGAYRLDTISPGQLDVWASARGRRPEHYEPRLAVAAGDHRDHIDLVLHAGGVEIHG